MRTLNLVDNEWVLTDGDDKKVVTDVVVQISATVIYKDKDEAGYSDKNIAKPATGFYMFEGEEFDMYNEEHRERLKDCLDMIANYNPPVQPIVHEVYIESEDDVTDSEAMIERGTYAGLRPDDYKSFEQPLEEVESHEVEVDAED